MILMDLSLDPLMIYLESSDIHTLFTKSSWTLSIDLMRFPSMFQILTDLSLDPLIIYLESADIHTLLTLELWAWSIDLIRLN